MRMILVFREMFGIFLTYQLNFNPFHYQYILRVSSVRLNMSGQPSIGIVTKRMNPELSPSFEAKGMGGAVLRGAGAEE